MHCLARSKKEDFVKIRKQNKDTMIFNKTGLLIDSIFQERKLNGY